MSRRQGIDLLGSTGATATGADVEWPGGKGVLTIDSTNYNGATITLQMKTPQGNYVAVNAATTFAAPAVAGSYGAFELPNCQLKVAISVAVPGAAVFARATGIPQN